MRTQARWPELPLAAWRDTCDTLHLYAQIVGKIRLALAPPEPEWAHVPLYVAVHGLTTGPLNSGERTFQIDFDFIAHQLRVATSDGARRELELRPRSVADFYGDLFDLLGAMRINVRIWPMPVEIANPVRFTDDVRHASYDREAVERFFQTLLRADEALREHRAPFRGRHTPVQFFWGTFDLAYARYSGRPATPPPGDAIIRGAMDAEEVCCGYWPGDERFPEPAFWCYAYPKPEGLERATIQPHDASWNAALGEYLLTYEAVRTSADPHAQLRAFFKSTYLAGASLGRWDAALPSLSTV
jgi:hypothetical protein